jgi:UDP-N-acetylmuramoylalanine--D-glutamate ligase
MIMDDWRGKRVLIIGSARQGLALTRFLLERGAQVLLNDRRPAAELQAEQQALAGLPVEWATGGHPLELLQGIDLLCPSGGVPLNLPLIVAAQQRGIPLSNDSQIFLEAAPCKVVGITGSAGKTTTTALVGQMMALAASAANPPAKAWMGGNVGNPLIADVAAMHPADWAVMELSSFQLEIMTRSPQVAAVLNITPNHLDRHGTMEAYTAAKAQILIHQTPDDTAILNRADPGAWSLAGLVRGGLLTFGITPPPPNQSGTALVGEWLTLWEGGSCQNLFPRQQIQLRGEHNLLNVLAACAIAAALGVSPEMMQEAVSAFRAVPHRLEWVRNWRGAAWYNDSIATAPERAMAAIRSFSEPLVLLAGGRDKDLPWDDFAALVRQRVDHLIVFGEAAGLVEKAVGSPSPTDRLTSVTRCAGLRQAVWAAAEVVEAGDVVLLSPGGTSFDEFGDFAERGEWFRRWVKELT